MPSAHAQRGSRRSPRAPAGEVRLACWPEGPSAARISAALCQRKSRRNSSALATSACVWELARDVRSKSAMNATGSAMRCEAVIGALPQRA
jgi:hypothetical protein